MVFSTSCAVRIAECNSISQRPSFAFIVSYVIVCIKVGSDTNWSDIDVEMDHHGAKNSSLFVPSVNDEKLDEP